MSEDFNIIERRCSDLAEHFDRNSPEAKKLILIREAAKRLENALYASEETKELLYSEIVEEMTERLIKKIKKRLRD